MASPPPLLLLLLLSSPAVAKTGWEENKVQVKMSKVARKIPMKEHY
jgi:hypothetical protein